MILRYLSSLLLLVAFQLTAQTNTTYKLKTILKTTANFRAITVLNDSTVCFANSQGTVGQVTLSGKTTNYNIDLSGGIKNHFRAIAQTKEHIFALSIESPSRLYKFKKQDFKTNGKLVFTDSNAKAFYDAMTFLDAKNGIAMGDPQTNCLSVITTHNGGESWTKLKCEDLPKSGMGEAAFAASNTNISSIGKKVWIATGGLKSRIFYSPNAGKTWTIYNTPFIQGKATTGIYTIDFYNKKNGIICGGDYTDKKALLNNKAITKDGGKTWNIVANNALPGYISCVQYVPKSKGKTIVAVSTEGIYISKNGGLQWSKISDEGFFTIRFVNQHLAFLGGQGRIATLNL